MNIFNVMAVYPIGKKLRLADDDPGTIREVYGYECFDNHANIIFKDGSKLSLSRLDLVVEVA